MLLLWNCSSSFIIMEFGEFMEFISEYGEKKATETIKYLIPKNLAIFVETGYNFGTILFQITNERVCWHQHDQKFY